MSEELEFVIDSETEYDDEVTVGIAYEDEYPEEDEEDAFDNTHYTEYVDPDSKELDFVNRDDYPKWDMSCVPEEVMEEIQQEFLEYNNGGIQTSKRVWKKYWEIDVENIDPMMSAADYYLLFGIISNAFVKFDPIKVPSLDKINQAGRKLNRTAKQIEARHKEYERYLENNPIWKLTKLKEKAEQSFREVVDDLDKNFVNYCHLACGGELRHHSAFGGVLSGYRKGAWIHWKFIFEHHGPEALNDMVELFLDFPDTVYGGPAWAEAANILWQRETGKLGPDEFTNKQLFVDRVFTLEHNGGCFLDKVVWANNREDRPEPFDEPFQYMKSGVLEYHCMEVVDIDAMLNYASEPVQQQVREFLDLAIECDLELFGIYKHRLYEQFTPVKVDDSHSHALTYHGDLLTLSESYKKKMLENLANHYSPTYDLYGTDLKPNIKLDINTGF